MENMLVDEAVQLTDNEGRTFAKNAEELKYYFNRFNQKYFGGVLEPIPLKWTARGDSKYGAFFLHHI